ncbi:hypothetical protein [Aneurinibacillus aneurinilyticus]|jgi:hypothetical protein|uniref:Uncharacterized protein n=2 Tax=Aneurinibacillus aneurinilyticus TaxID=1391 RepID=A0A848D5I9_ANEAE|nr:hypothetical protein [Aneurinibacillus aneurinilyticus]ERI10317.1 hypothetical protein HMPREF0083_01591 [Aneurinibacillus aneurinilyticus ATCC 12856]MCI1696906.1 hypothetical protein [Aneurinibacillus aneurinilyticus]MED0709683.1 hypothetical protein [Aneurinibacillus aneurinilyticus]MED0724923.1 hypothetical protein [Aneurinibacillus aneurinilyticus]MED0731055.1 hypothetical protein [Aneurinibacillus aneurinilyticus]
MNLLDIQNQFNEIYNFQYLRDNTIRMLEDLIKNSNDNYLKEEEDKLPDGLKLKDFIIRYNCIRLFINNHDREIPFLRVYLELLHPKTEIQRFYYDVEYTVDGEFSDDFFGEYK